MRFPKIDVVSKKVGFEQRLKQPSANEMAELFPAFYYF